MLQNEHKNDGGLSRRGFMSRAAVGGLALAGLSFLNIGCGDSTDDIVLNPGTPNNGNVPGSENFPGIPGENLDIVVLNFALTLEYLEADLYRQALNIASGRNINDPLDGNPNSYTRNVGDGGLGARADAGFLYLQQYAYVEQAHVDFLNNTIPALGGTPVGRNPGGYQADFGNDLESILTVIRTLEEEGVRAYLGAAGFLSALPLIQTAGTIYSTEARHSAALNYVLGLPTGPQRMSGDMSVVDNPPAQNTFEYFRTPSQVVQDIQPFLA